MLELILDILKLYFLLKILEILEILAGGLFV